MSEFRGNPEYKQDKTPPASAQPDAADRTDYLQAIRELGLSNTGTESLGAILGKLARAEAVAPGEIAKNSGSAPAAAGTERVTSQPLTFPKTDRERANEKTFMADLAKTLTVGAAERARRYEETGTSPDSPTHSSRTGLPLTTAAGRNEEAYLIAQERSKRNSETQKSIDDCDPDLAASFITLDNGDRKQVNIPSKVYNGKCYLYKVADYFGKDAVSYNGVLLPLRTTRDGKEYVLSGRAEYKPPTTYGQYFEYVPVTS